MVTTLTATEFHARDDRPDWRYALGRIEASFRCGSFEGAAELAPDDRRRGRAGRPPPRPRHPLPGPPARRADDARRRRRHRPRRRPGRRDLGAGRRGRRDERADGGPGAARWRSTPWTSTPCSRSGRPCSTTTTPPPGRDGQGRRRRRPGPHRAGVLVPADGRAPPAAQPHPPRRDRAPRRRRGARRRGRSPPAARSSATGGLARSGCSPTPRATRRASARGRTATERRVRFRRGVTPDPGTGSSSESARRLEPGGSSRWPASSPATTSSAIATIRSTASTTTSRWGS